MSHHTEKSSQRTIDRHRLPPNCYMFKQPWGRTLLKVPSFYRYFSRNPFVIYCCPVKLKMSCKSSPKPSKHRHRGLFFEKQAPLIKKRRFWWRFRVPFIRDFYPFFFRISHKCNEVDIIHECQTHHGDNLRECAAALDAT